MRLPNYFHEAQLFKQGIKMVVGVDEAGRGPLAGPVVAAAVVFDSLHAVKFFYRLGARDSKKISPKTRSQLCDQIKKKCRWSVGVVTENEIDAINIFHAALKAMRETLQALELTSAAVLVDGPWRIRDLAHKQRPIVGGGGLSVAIACASIVAKVTRDAMMIDLHSKIPQYGFDQHKGYATQEHYTRLKTFGASPVHRQTFLKPGAPTMEVYGSETSISIV